MAFTTSAQSKSRSASTYTTHSGRSFSSSFNTPFKPLRETNIEFIRGLPGSDGSRVALHKEAGEITLAQMLHEWAMHDLGHIRQIAELVRARKYLEGAGPLGASYNLKP